MCVGHGMFGVKRNMPFLCVVSQKKLVTIKKIQLISYKSARSIDNHNWAGQWLGLWLRVPCKASELVNIGDSEN